MNGTQIMIAILGGMLFVEILLTVWLGFYMAKVFNKTEADDAALFLQGRDIAATVKEMRELVQRSAGVPR